MGQNRSDLNFFIFQLAALAFCSVIATNMLKLLIKDSTWFYLKTGKSGFYLSSDLALFLWLLPLILHFYNAIHERKLPQTTLSLSIIALILSALSLGTSIRFLSHLGFASAFGALYPFNKKTLVWIITSISWMPAIAWFNLKSGLSGFDPLIRIIIALIGSTCLLYQKRSTQYERA